jgi:hypothetical protein
MAAQVTSNPEHLLVPQAAQSDFVIKRLFNLNRRPRTGK